ncbi:hypothetical protein LJY25_18240 [Hymenobacter sp. BT175]|uniref:hypothetical protein n=1 Tax=Hymenobacter translucens TaxID=2886507 RepID=UPI001D0DEFFE|nr:hypothetical protein [Hymenobacter translucens]MCC2548392.1 hypothetical protein [Hymenobacter translucens]
MKATRLSVLLLSSLLGLGATSCFCGEKEEVCPAEDSVKVTYAQTQCADHWGQASDPQVLASKASAYLTQKGVQVYSVTAASTGPAQVCSACTCLTGNVVEAYVAQADLPTVLGLGFKQ